MCAHWKEGTVAVTYASAMKHGMIRDIAVAKERGKMMCKEKKRWLQWSRRSKNMNRSEFIRKWEHMFKLINDENVFPGNTSEDLPILMLRDAIQVIMTEA